MQPNLLSGLLNNASTSMKVVQTNAKKKEELAKKELGTLSNVAKTTTAVAKANTPQVVGGFWDKSNPQSLLDLHKTTTGFQPLEFDNLMGTKQIGIPNLWFTDLGTKSVAPEKFKTELDKTEEGRKDNIRSVLKVVENGWVVTKQDIDVLLKPLKTDEEKRKVLDLVWNSWAKIEGIHYNTEQENLMSIGNTGISVNPIKQAGEKILELKDYLKNNPKGADPFLKTLIEWVVSQFDPTWWIYTKWIMQTDAVNNILPNADNPITQWALWFAGNTVKWVWQVVEWWAGLVDKGIALWQSVVEWWPISKYQTRQTGIGEDILDVWAGATQTLASIYAMPASLLIGTGIEALPEEWQKAVAETMIWLWGIIAQTPWLKEWMESLPKNRQDEFKSELAGATVWLLMWLKNKWNIIKNPKLFLKENLNPVNIAKNFNENVIGIPSKALDMAVNTVGKVKIHDVNIKTPNIWLKNLLPTAENTLQRMNRLTKLEQEKFKVMAWKEVWEWLNERWIVWDPTETITELSDRFINTKNQVDEWLSEIKGNYKTEALDMMLDDSIRFADNTRDTNLNRLKELQQKNKELWLDMSEINEVKRFFEKNNKFSYGRDITAWEKTAWATNIDNEVRNRQMNIAEENWFTNLRELNKETQASKYIMDKLAKNESGKLGNNAITITDWIVAAPAMVDPTFLSLLVWKKLFNSNWFAKQYINVINRLNWHTNIADKVADLVQIKKIQNEKDLNKFLALPYKWDLWEKPNTIILPWKDIITTPWWNLKKWGILEINSKKNDTSNINNNSNLSNIKNSWQVKNKWLSNLKDQWNMPKLPPKNPKELPAKQKVADTPLSNLKNPKKSVQSDTLVSKSDEMEADKLANAQYIKEDTISNIQSIAKKNPEIIRKLLQKDWLPDNKIQSFIDDASNGKISERQAKNVSDALVSKSDSMKTPYSNSFDAYKAIWDDARATKAFERAQLPTSEIKAKYKDGTLTKQDVQDIIYAKEQDAQSQYIYERSIKRKIDRWWRNENDIILSLKNMITDNVNTKPKNILAPKSKDLQPLYEEAKKYRSADEMIKKNIYYRWETWWWWNYYSTDFDFARDFIPSWLDSEVKKAHIVPDDILIEKELPSANSEKEITNTIEKAKKLWKKAIMVSEWKWQPNSVFVFDKSSIKTESQLRKIREEANHKSTWLSNLKNK